MPSLSIAFVATLGAALLAQGTTGSAQDTYGADSRTQDEDDLFRLILQKMGPNAPIDHVRFLDGAFWVHRCGCVIQPLPPEIPRTWRGAPVEMTACGIAGCEGTRHRTHRSSYLSRA